MKFRLIAVGLLAVVAGFAQTPKITGIVSAADFSGNISTNSYIAIFGTGLSDGEYRSPSPYQFQLGKTSVFVCVDVDFGCRSIQLAYVSPGQINAVLNGIPGYDQLSQVPYFFKVQVAGTYSPSAPAIIRDYYPAVFYVGRDCSSDYRDIDSSTGCGITSQVLKSTQVIRSAITDAAGNLLWSGNAAKQGSFGVVWLTGLGDVSATSIASFPVSVLASFNTTGNPTRIAPAYVGGPTPGLPGLYQVNFLIPPISPCGVRVEMSIRVERAKPIGADPRLYFTAWSSESFIPVDSPRCGP